MLGISKVQGISHHLPQGVNIAPASNGNLYITFADDQSHACTINVYSLSGSLILSRPRTLLAAQSTIHLGTIATGVYIIQIQADSPKLSGSTLVRFVEK